MNLADRSSKEWYRMEDLRGGGSGHKEAESRVVLARSVSFRGWQGSAGPITDLVLTR